MNPYHQYVQGISHLLHSGKELSLGGFDTANHPTLPENAPKVMIFSPHPDDECIVGGLPLRLMKENGFRVINVAVTLGSHQERRQGRLKELKAACSHLGFDLLETAPDGLEKIKQATRDKLGSEWSQSVDCIKSILKTHLPRLILLPHQLDQNSTHMGTFCLVMDALRGLGPSFNCFIAETEFWSPMKHPNLMVQSSVEDVGQLMAALSFHVGEVSRNPYHLRTPAWMIDNVRRGGELVGNQGGTPPDFDFATLYHLEKWENRKRIKTLESGRFMGTDDGLAELLK